MRPATTRRRFIEAAGASAAALATGESAEAQQRRRRGDRGRRRDSGRRRHDGPNVVVVIVDTLRADHVYGDRAKTPNMDALARDGVRFTQCYPEAMPTVPARNSILSGRRVFPFRGWRDYKGLIAEPGWSPLRNTEQAFTTRLRKAGYWTAYVTDNPFLGFAPPYARFRNSFNRFAREGGQVGGKGTGVSKEELRHWLHPAMEDAQTRVRMRRYLSNANRYWLDDSRSFAARVFKDGMGLLDDAKRNRPFAMVLDTFEPHEPWTPPRKLINLYGDPDYRGPEPAKPYYAAVGAYLNDGNRKRLLNRMEALYAAEVTMTDKWLGHFMDRLHARRLDRETVVVLCSDHGFLFGERGFTGKKSHELHPALNRVPLTIVHPDRRRAGYSSDRFASTHDIAPTVLRMAGVRVRERMEGHNLSKVFRGKLDERKFAFGGYANNFYIRSDRWLLIGNNLPGAFKLYDLKNDPSESRNVASSHPGKVRQLYGIVEQRSGGPLPFYDY